MFKTKNQKLKKKLLFHKTIMVSLLLFFMMGLWNMNIKTYVANSDISFNDLSVNLSFKNKTKAWSIGNVLESLPLSPWKVDPDHPLLSVGLAAKGVKWVGNGLLWVFNWLLYAVWWLLSYLMVLAGLLFDWAIDAHNLKAIIHKEGIYEAWKIVRDFLNLGFILVLLFSAFSTVFQIEKYHLKKILLMLVLMALLVNFSFPISRFIIDSSNVTMYYLLNQRFANNYRQDSLSARIVNYTHITSQFVGEGKKDVDMSSSDYTKKIIAAIVFTFILMITMIAMAVIMVIRVFALAIIIIFSPVGFVAAILPSTKSLADKWWDNLFKYSFVGPTMIFMVIIAFRLMDDMQGSPDSALGTLMRLSADYVPGKNTLSLGDAAYFFLPVILLWASILTAQSMGIYGASTVVSWAKSVQQRAAKGVTKIAYMPVKATGIPGGVKQRVSSIREKWDSARQAREARIAAFLKDEAVMRKDMLRRSSEYEKNHATDEELRQRARKGDDAAAYTLASRGKMDEKVYAEVQSKLAKKDPKALELINGKVKERRMDLVINYKSHNEQELNKAKQILADQLGTEPEKISNNQAQEFIVKQEIGGLSPDKFANQDWSNIRNNLNKLKDKKIANQIKIATANAFQNMPDRGRGEVAEKLSPNNAKILREEFGLIV